MTEATLRTIRVCVVTASSRAAAGEYSDRSGPAICELLGSESFEVADPVVVADGRPVGEALRKAVAAGFDVVITTGGTGLAPTDRTPEETLALVEREVPGLAEAIRSAGVGAGVATAMLSRGVAGVAGRTLVVNLPGSVGGATDGVAVLLPVLRHAVDQIAGGDH